MWSDGLVCFSDFSKWHDFCVSGFVLFHLAALSYIIVLSACKYYGQPPAKFRWGQSNVNKCVCTNDVSKQSQLLWCFLPLFLLLWDCKSFVEPAVVLHSLGFSLTACLGLFFLFFFPPLFGVEFILWNENNGPGSPLGSISHLSLLLPLL